MLKKYLLLILAVSFILQSFAQEKTDGFDINKMFVGGSVVLGYGGYNNGTRTTLGGNPELGYTIFKNVDAGFCGNYIYSGSSWNEGGYTIKQRVTLSGLGVFARIHVSDGFFLHFQPEFNTIKYKVFNQQTGFVSYDAKEKSSSFLVGAGWGTREVGNMNFFTLLLIDLQKDLYSPYRTSTGEISPVIRTGVNFYFHKKRKK